MLLVHYSLHVFTCLKSFFIMNLNPAHWHLLFNHLPVAGIMFLALLLAYGLVRKSNSVIVASYWFFVLLAVLTFITSNTGGNAAGYLHNAGLASDDRIKAHAEASDKAEWAIYIGAALSLATLFVRRLKTTRAMPVVILVVSLAGVALMSWTSLLGGEIMHKEIRPGFTAKP